MLHQNLFQGDFDRGSCGFAADQIIDCDRVASRTSGLAA